MISGVLVALLTSACASTAELDASILRTGFLLRTGSGLQLFETKAARDTRDPNACVQVLRDSPLQDRGDYFPEGRVQVMGSDLLPRGGWGDAVEVRSGRDRVTNALCRSQYIYISSITDAGS